MTPAGPVPVFSIGVTTYRRSELLKEALASLTAQTFTDFEVIVGNDYPGEVLGPETLHLGDPRIRFVNHPQNLGEVPNMNSLLGMARGQYFTWLADDDLYVPRFLSCIHDALVRHQHPRCVFTGYTNALPPTEDAALEPVKQEVLSGREFLSRYLGGSIAVLGCYGVFETGYLRSIGGMEQMGTGFSPYADNLLAIRQGVVDRLVYIDAPLIVFRAHPGSLSWSSGDLDAYSTAQEALCRRSVEVLEPALADRVDEILFSLLGVYCIPYYYSVMRRSPSIPLFRLVAYWRLIHRFALRLDARRRSSVYLQLARETTGFIRCQATALLRRALPGVVRWRQAARRRRAQTASVARSHEA